MNRRTVLGAMSALALINVACSTRQPPKPTTLQLLQWDTVQAAVLQMVSPNTPEMVVRLFYADATGYTMQAVKPHIKMFDADRILFQERAAFVRRSSNYQLAHDPQYQDYTGVSPALFECLDFFRKCDTCRVLRLSAATDTPEFVWAWQRSA